MKKYIIYLLFLSFISCDKEFLDPTRPTDGKIFTTREGLIGAANGLQSRWSVGGQSPLYQSIVLSGCTTNEAFFQGGNVNEVELQAGGQSVSTRNSVITNVWTQCLITKSESEKVLASLDLLTDPVEKASVKAHTSIFKALALGTLAQFFEKAPLVTGVNATFNTRTQVLQEAINTLSSNIPTINQATGIPAANVLANSIKYKNTIYALLARYSLMIGDNTNALAYANLVDLTSKSTFLFDATSSNPVFASGVNPTPAIGFRPFNNRFGLPTVLAPVATDGRIAFYFTATQTAGFYNSVGFFDNAAKLIPVYLPGEITLIKAEAYARSNDLSNATTELNKILQKTAALDSFMLAANLPAYSGPNTQTDLLLEIYRNRCIELYLTGMKLEDTRRFGRAITPAPFPAGTLYECNRRFMPYPDQERFNNTNTPADPAI
jgi:starch-binding outer membrane protein, SusD/RagB family